MGGMSWVWDWGDGRCKTTTTTMSHEQQSEQTLLDTACLLFQLGGMEEQKDYLLLQSWVPESRDHGRQ